MFQESQFLLKIIAKNLLPELKDKTDLVLGFPEKFAPVGGFTTRVKVAASIHSSIFFDERFVHYSRFRMNDYKPKSTDHHLKVPADRASTPTELINYMNEFYLNSANVREQSEDYALFRGFQVLLKLENLEPFELNAPVVGDNLTVTARQLSFLFEGSLLIEFV